MHRAALRSYAGGVKRLWLGSFVALLFLGQLLCMPAARAADLTLTFFSVGQGDAALIVSPTGKTVLIDGGPPEGTQALLSGLARRGVRGLDLVILSHPHLDHLGALRALLATMPVKTFLDAGYPSTSPFYTALVRDIAAKNIAVRQATRGRTIDIGDGASLYLLGPPSPWLVKTRSDANANSVVARLSWRGRTALFTGDAEPQTERWLLEQSPGDRSALAAEVLKVAHHGGRFSSTLPFLQAVAPRLAVISVGMPNDYGHPTPEALARLGQVGARVLRTDQLGTVTLRSHDGQAWTIEAEAGAPVALNPPAAAPIPAPAPAPQAADVPAPSADGYLGSVRSDVFHRAGCAAAQKIIPANQLRFATRAAALASGRRPAADCNP